MFEGKGVIDAEFRVLHDPRRHYEPRSHNKSAYSERRLKDLLKRPRPRPDDKALARMVAAQVQADRRQVIAFVRQQRHFPWPFRKLRFVRI